MFVVGQPLAEDDRAIVAAVVAGAVSFLVAVLGALVAYFSTRRQQRRATYSEAVRAATAWEELLYRVRRRQQDNGPAIVELFHSAQESLAYYEAWVGVESKFMARSYQRLVTAVKGKTDTLIREAWHGQIRSLPGDVLESDLHPQLAVDVEAFLRDVRSHLSPWPWRKLVVAARNREK